MNKQSVIKSKAAKTRVQNLVVSKLNNALSIFSEAPKVKIESETKYYTTIVVEEIHIMTFAVIDTIREVAEEFKVKYEGFYYVMSSRQYLAKDGETWLHRPVFEINIRRYDK